jgi:hypothetical protein
MSIHPQLLWVACSLAAVRGSGGVVDTSSSSSDAITGSSSGNNPGYTYLEWDGDDKCCEILDDEQSSCPKADGAVHKYQCKGWKTGRRLSAGAGPVGPLKADTGSTVAIVFMVLAVFVGVLAEQVLKKLHKYGGPAIPYTAFILIIGLITRIAAEAKGTYKHLSCSFHVWETMDGHLLLYAFIPPLVFGDAMNLDFNILKNCVSQCATLAFPGVAIGAALFAVIVKYVIPSTAHWGWDLSLAFGAVMSATDPVAVVALLKQLGAPDSLTMIIGGESLLNDGMAMILWAVRRTACCLPPRLRRPRHRPRHRPHHPRPLHQHHCRHHHHHHRHHHRRLLAITAAAITAAFAPPPPSPDEPYQPRERTARN